MFCSADYYKPTRLDFQGDTPPLDLVSLYIDQYPQNDIGRTLAKESNIPLYKDHLESLNTRD